MSFHFCAHAWEVRDLEDGTVVKLRNRDLNAETVPVLVDELYVLVEESGRPNLDLDFADIGLMSSLAIGKMIALHAKLKEHGGRLSLINVKPMLYETLQAVQLTDLLDVQIEETASVR